VKDIMKRLSEKRISIHLTASAKEFLINKGFDPIYGARPLKRALQKYLEDPLAEEILKGSFKEGDKIAISARNGQIVFRKKEEKKKVGDKV
jgi:ATP-dependent Clp protease ATP-binding subunit ClpC